MTKVRDDLEVVEEEVEIRELDKPVRIGTVFAIRQKKGIKCGHTKKV